MSQEPDTLIICCGAIAKEIIALSQENGWDKMRVECLPASLHNDPDQLPERVRGKIRDNKERYDSILVLYSDCGTGGAMQRMLDEEGVESIGGAHCYEVFTGSAHFHEMITKEPGCFFLTDFLARHFEKLVFRGLGLDRFPRLRDTYFGNYTKMVYLAQVDDADLVARAQAAADSVGLELEIRRTGYGDYEAFLTDRLMDCSFGCKE